MSEIRINKESFERSISELNTALKELRKAKDKYDRDPDQIYKFEETYEQIDDLNSTFDNSEGMPFKEKNKELV